MQPKGVKSDEVGVISFKSKWDILDLDQDG
jgi:hypothetical protein